MTTAINNRGDSLGSVTAVPMVDDLPDDLVVLHGALKSGGRWRAVTLCVRCPCTLKPLL